MRHPSIIQGGMGVGVSDWRLARAVASRGQLGVVSGTALAHVFASRMRQGDPGGHLRRALAAFPDQALAAEVAARGDRPAPMPTVEQSRDEQSLTVVAAFCEVWLAKDGHGGLVGFNLLEKIQLPNLASLYGAMLAGVDYVLMGAGIPKAIPAALDALAIHADATQAIALDVGAVEQVFSPRALMRAFPSLRRPYFLPIIASDALAASMLRRATGRIDGFIVEGWTAGGHNAPPRGGSVNERGEPLYGERDRPDLARLRTLGLPFWLAGSCATSAAWLMARAEGAHGVQVGTAFAFSEESGIDSAVKDEVLALVRSGRVRVRSDPLASPTGFPFKIVGLDGSISQPEIHQHRRRICDVGYLRTPYRRPDGSIGYRCPGEPEAHFIAKGGDPAAMAGKVCLCNGLLATVGHGMPRSRGAEPVLVTAGDDVAALGRYLAPGTCRYGVADVIAGFMR